MRIKPRILLISLVTAVSLYALLGFLLLPALGLYVVNQQFEQRARVPAQLQNIRFNPFTLEMTLSGLHIGEPEQPEIAFSSLYANLQVSSLWQRALHFRAVELERASSRVRFAQDGTLNLTELFILPETGDKPEESSEGEVFPLRIDRLALIGNSLEFQDLRPAEAVEFGYDAVDIELNNLSTLPDDNTLMHISASGPYGARIEWEGQLSISPLASSGTLQVQDAQLKTFWPYAHEQLPLVLNQGTLNLSSRYEFSLTDRTELMLSDIRLQLNDLSLATTEQSVLNLESLLITDATVDLVQQEVRLGSIRSQGLEAWAARLQDGQIDWQQWLPPAAPAEAIGTTQETTPLSEAEPGQSSDIASVAEPGEPEPVAWRILLGEAQLQNYRLRITDHQPAKPVQLDIGPLNLTVSDFDSQSESPFQLSLDTAMNQDGKLAVTGPVGINPLGADLQISTRNIDLALAQPYLEPLVRLELKSGVLDSQLRLRLLGTSPLQLEVDGQAAVHRLHVVDGPGKRDLLKWQSLQLNELHYQDDSLNIGRIDLQQPYVRFIINRDMSTNFSDLVISRADSDNTSTEPGKPFGLRIGGVSIKDGSANFADFSLTPNFATGIEQLNGSIGTLDNRSNRTAAVDLHGKVDRYAPVTINGSLTPFDPLNSLDIATRFESVELTTLTPYSGKFAGYPIRKGRLNLDLHYRINQGQLRADNRLLLEDLQLGERVDSPDAVDLPIRLAVALLKDTKGNIDIELPVSGDLNNPEFSVMPIVWQTLRNLVVRATQAPFKFIAGLAGAGDADLSQLSFSPGSDQLNTQTQQTLNTLASALQERPQLILEVQGVSAVGADGPALAARRLDQEMRQLAASRMRRAPEDLTEIELDEKDQARLINELYEQQQLQQPDAWQKLTREERNLAKRQALIDRWSGAQLPLRRLAQQRAATIKHWLVDEGGLEADRIHLLEVSEGDPDADGNIAAQLHLGSG